MTEKDKKKAKKRQFFLTEQNFCFLTNRNYIINILHVLRSQKL